MIDLKKIIGSIYTGVSDDFQRGLFPIFRCVKAENHDLGVVEMEVRQIGNLWGNDTDFENKTSGRVYDKNGISPTLNTMQGGWKQPMIVSNQIVAMRGRNPENPSDRTAGSPTEQRLEPNSQGICNTLTSVQKDNMVLEKNVCAIDEQNMNFRYETFGTLTTDGSSPKHNNRVMEYTNAQYRIRKLTPRECWRLMDFTDEDFDKAAEVNSNTQLYKQAGNSIVKNCMVAILGQMIPGKEDVYKTRCS